VRVKILEIDSERRRLSLSVKRVEEQLAHIKSAAEAGAAAAEANAGEIGDVPDLGLSEDVFAGPSIGGLDALRNLPADAPEQAEEPAPAAEQRAPEAEQQAPEGEQQAPEAEAAAAPEVPEAEPAPDAVDAEPAPDAEPAAEASEEPAAPPSEDEESQDQ
jgi:small subunit ribosomal protein S1